MKVMQILQELDFGGVERGTLEVADFLVKKRQSEGTCLFSKRDSLHNVGAFLKSGGMIGTLADQRVGRQGEVTSFIDRGKMHLSEEKGLSGWLGSTEARSSRHPHRALVLLPACLQDWAWGEIARIDASAALPLDFVLAGCHDNSLRRAARREAFQFFPTAS